MMRVHGTTVSQVRAIRHVSKAARRTQEDTYKVNGCGITDTERQPSHGLPAPDDHRGSVSVNVPLEARAADLAGSRSWRCRCVLSGRASDRVGLVSFDGLTLRSRQAAICLVL